MATIHGASHKALKHLRKPSSALAVFWIYASRTNNEGIAWPSLAGLSKDTGWNKEICGEARAFLVEHGALELVADYIQPKWRKLTPQQLTRHRNFDKSEYYRVTGILTVKGQTFNLLYYPQSEPSDLDSSDVLQNLTSENTGHQEPLDIQQNRPELGLSSSELGLSSSELNPTHTRQSAKPKTPHPKPEIEPALTHAVQAHIFGIADVMGIPATPAKQTGKRIKDIAQYLQAAQVVPQKAESELKGFVKWYHGKYGPDCNLPLSVDTFATHYTLYSQSKVGRAEPGPAYEMPELTTPANGYLEEVIES